MAIEARLEHLDLRHRELETEIAQEMSHPAHDEAKIHELKRQKLRIKDEMQELRRSATQLQ